MVRLSLRRLQPGAVFASFLGILDIKLGCEIVLLFGLIHKVAGVYGLITLVIKAWFVQYLFYAYSIATLFAFLWALNVVKRETAHKTLLVAHLYALDHAIQVVFHYSFYYMYWFINPHDGRRTLNSQAQKDIYELALSRNETTPIIDTDADDYTSRVAAENAAAAAEDIWNHEKGYALGVIFLGFLFKIYFILLLYSYAAHLRSNTYNTLPLTAHARSLSVNGGNTSTRQVGGARNGPVAHVIASVEDDDRELASAEAEVARIRAEARASSAASASGVPSSVPAAADAPSKGKKKDDHDEFDDWE